MKNYPVCNELKLYLFILTRPGWSEECTEQESSALCAQVLNCLLDVISAFHIGRGGTSMSYMGKGVTKAATLCLRHLVYEMATTMDDKVRGMSLVVRKLVFGVSDQVIHQPGCRVTEDG